MLIKDVLAPYYAADPFSQLVACSKLNSDMNNLAMNHAGWEFFNWYWRRFDGRDSSDIYASVHPDVLVAAASSLGFQDIEPLTEWVESLKQPMAGLVQTIAKGTSSNINLSYDQMQDISYEEIESTMLAAGEFSPVCKWHRLDDAYKLPSKSDVLAILAACPSNKMQYRSNRSDCDDFANMFKGWLGSIGYGNISVGYVEMYLLDDTGNVTGAHAVNSILYRDDDGSIKAALIEPQTNQMHDMKTPWVGGGISGTPVRQMIYWVVM